MKKAFFIFFFLGLTNNVFSQFRWKAKPEEIPLLKFLQENFDSTVVYSPHVFSGTNKNRFWIVSKKGNDLVFSVYENLYKIDLYKDYPQLLTEKFFKLDSAYRKVLPDTNIYYHPFVVGFQKIKEPWNTITANNFWCLRDDYADKNCYEFNYLMDYSFDVFYRITKNEIKILSFGPIQFDRQCTSKPEEISKALNIIQAFISVFNKPDVF